MEIESAIDNSRDALSASAEAMGPGRGSDLREIAGDHYQSMDRWRYPARAAGQELAVDAGHDRED